MRTRTADGEQSGFVNAPRLNKALTAAFEKRLLMWMAQRTPAAISSDHLTGLALVSQLCAGAAYARVRNEQRPRYGFYVDHIADILGGLALMAGLGCSGYLHGQTAAGMLVCFCALSIESYLATYTIGRFHLSHDLFGPTEIRILLMAANAIALLHPSVTIANRRFLLFDVAGAVAIAGMALMFLGAALRHTLVLYREGAPFRRATAN